MAKPSKAKAPTPTTITRDELRAIVREAVAAETRAVFNTVQAADYLGVSTQYLEIGRTKGYGPPFTRIGRLVKYLRADLDSWLTARRRNNTAEMRDGDDP